MRKFQTLTGNLSSNHFFYLNTPVAEFAQNFTNENTINNLLVNFTKTTFSIICGTVTHFGSPLGSSYLTPAPRPPPKKIHDDTTIFNTILNYYLSFVVVFIFVQYIWYFCMYIKSCYKVLWIKNQQQEYKAEIDQMIWVPRRNIGKTFNVTTQS